MKVRAVILPVVLMGLAACQPSKPEAEAPAQPAATESAPEAVASTASAEQPSEVVEAPETAAPEPEKAKVEAKPEALAPAAPAAPAPVVVASAPPIQPGVLPAGAGRNVAQRLCSSCHSLVLLTATGHTEDEWDSIVARMENNGMMASPEDIDTVITYLGKALPPR